MKQVEKHSNVQEALFQRGGESKQKGLNYQLSRIIDL